MKITVKHLDTKITIDESDNPKADSNRFTTLRFDNEAGYIIQVLKEITERVLELNAAKNGEIKP